MDSFWMSPSTSIKDAPFVAAEEATATSTAPTTTTVDTTRTKSIGERIAADEGDTNQHHHHHHHHHHRTMEDNENQEKKDEEEHNNGHGDDQGDEATTLQQQPLMIVAVASNRSRREKTKKREPRRRRRRNAREMAVPPPQQHQQQQQQQQHERPNQQRRHRQLDRRQRPTGQSPFVGLGIIRRVRMERYNSETRQHQTHVTPAVCLHCKSQLTLFLLTLVPFAIMDEWTLLPTGIILYTVALQLAWENWTLEVEWQRHQNEFLQRQQEQRRRLRQAVDRARFEVHVLQDRPFVPVVPRPQRRRDGNTGMVDIYSM